MFREIVENRLLWRYIRELTKWSIKQVQKQLYTQADQEREREKKKLVFGGFD